MEKQPTYKIGKIGGEPLARNNQIQIEFKVINAEFQKAMKEMSSEVTKLNREFRLEQEQLRVNGTEKEKLESRVRYLNERYKLQQKEVKAVTEQLNTAKDMFGENSKEVQQLENRLLEAQRKEAYFANELEITSKALAEQNDKFKQLGKSMQEFGGKMQDVGSKMTDTGKNLTLKLTAPIVGVAGAATKLGIDFEKAMSEVQAASGASAEELEQLERVAREAGATTDKSASEAASALKNMALAGWSVEESQEALLPVLKLSSAANMDLDRTSSLVTDTMSTLGLEIEDLELYLDILAETSRNSNTDIDQLGEAFLNVGGKLEQLGVGVYEGATTLGILANNGIKGSEAGRGLNAVLTNLTHPTGQAKVAMEELGISVFDNTGRFIGIEESLKLVDDAMEGMTDQQRNMYMSMIAGKEHSKTFGALMNSLDGDFEELSETVWGVEDALDQMYETATDNTMGAINNLKSAVEELGLKIFENLQPHIEKLVEWVQNVTDKFNALTPEQQENIVKIGMLVAAIGPALIILGKLFGAVGTVITVFGQLIPLAKALGVGIGAMTAPVAITVGAIAGIIAISVALWKNWDTVKEKAAQLGSYLSEKFKQIKEWISSPIKSAIDFVGRQVDRLKNFFSGLKLTIPKPKMPKFSLSGKLSLMPPSVPKLSVSWHKEGAIFTRPTIFNTRQGLHGVGEAGPEAVLPISKLAGMIQEVIDKERDLGGMCRHSYQTIEITVPVHLNGKQIAIASAPQMSIELEKLAVRKRR